MLLVTTEVWEGKMKHNHVTAKFTTLQMYVFCFIVKMLKQFYDKEEAEMLIK